MTDRADICIIGAGPAGMMAALEARGAGATVALLEKNSHAGRKLLVTGGRRCNLTHAGDVADFVRACQPFGRTLKPAFYACPPQQTLAFFHQHRLATYVDETGCVFPVSERASDVHRILLDAVLDSGAVLHYSRPVCAVEKQPDGFVIDRDGTCVHAAAVIVATGGQSWPQTGSTGDGYRIARSLGHTIEPVVGVLCPMTAAEAWPGQLQGVSLDRAAIRLKGGSKAAVFAGKMVFTADGIGGPAVFDVSRVAAALLETAATVPVTLDFFPEMPRDALAAAVVERCRQHAKQTLAGILTEWLPKRLAGHLAVVACGPQPVAGAHLTKSQRLRLIEAMKATPLTLTGTGPLEKATVTRGGVCRAEIDPQTLQSRLCPGLYFAGEVLDVDGPCGGYNLQIAFSTGVLAGRAAAGSLRDAGVG